MSFSPAWRSWSLLERICVLVQVVDKETFFGMNSKFLIHCEWFAISTSQIILFCIFWIELEVKVKVNLYCLSQSRKAIQMEV